MVKVNYLLTKSLVKKFSSFSKKILSVQFNYDYNVKTQFIITKNINVFGKWKKNPIEFDLIIHRVYFFRDLSTKLQDTLDFIEESIDVTLAKLCSNFNSHIYQRLLNAYRLLGKSLTFMDQLQMHFVNVVQTRTVEILLKHIGTTKNERNLSSYVELCKV